MSIRQRRMLIERNHPSLTLKAQCELLDLPLSSLYYMPEPLSAEDDLLMRKLDGFYLETPFYGVRRMTWRLRQEGHLVNDKRVRRLLRLMRLEAIYPKPRLSKPGESAQIYPYLLRGMPITTPDLVWATDITYIRMRRGFIYLCAVMDWATRYVISWEVSTTLDTFFCIETLERALATGRQPQIFNSDQGSQFTSDEFLRRLRDRGIRISHDGRGRCLDNVFVERLWRTVKYEEVFLKEYESPAHARQSLQRFFAFYNERRPHFALDMQPPSAVYFGAQKPDKEESDQPHQGIASSESRGSHSLLSIHHQPRPKTN
jgi:putative transposase